jgi:hypothetical protein
MVLYGPMLTTLMSRHQSSRSAPRIDVRRVGARRASRGSWQVSVVMWRIFLVAHTLYLRSTLARAIREQAAGTLRIVGESDWTPDVLVAVALAQPDVVVLGVGFEVSSQLRIVPAIRRLAPACRVLAIDTLDGFADWTVAERDAVDALLGADELATLFVPTITGLSARPGSPPLHDGGLRRSGERT